MARNTAHEAFRDFSYNQLVHYTVYSLMLKSVQLASEQVLFDVEIARNDLFITHDTFCIK